MFALLLALASLSQPASFEFALEGNRNVTVQYGDQILRPGVAYAVSPFIGTRVITLQVSWVDGDEIIRRNLRVELDAGHHHTFGINIPRAVPNVALVRAP